jgi:hypothetical protein
LGFAVWVDENEQVVWAQGTHEYRPIGAAVVAICDQFRLRDFRQSLKRPLAVHRLFVGFFGSLEAVNEYVRTPHDERSFRRKRSFRPTPAHLI